MLEPDEPNTLFTCTAPGPAVLSLTVAPELGSEPIGVTRENCTDTQSVTVQCFVTGGSGGAAGSGGSGSAAGPNDLHEHTFGHADLAFEFDFDDATG